MRSRRTVFQLCVFSCDVSQKLFFGSQTPFRPSIASTRLASLLLPAALLCTLSGCSSSVHTIPPQVTISVSPATITLGDSSTLTWSSTNATSCTASGAWTGAQATGGSLNLTPTSASTLTYTLTCTGAGGSANNSATLTVNPPPTPTVTIGVSPSAITLGSSATLTWSSTNATACTASGAWTGAQATSGSLDLTPTSATTLTYTLTCTGTGGSGNNSATLTVNPPPLIGFTYTFNSPLNNLLLANLSGLSEDASGTLSVLSDSPYNSGIETPQTMVVDQPLQLVFAGGGAGATQPTGEIVAFSINTTTGSLTQSAVTVPALQPSDMAIGPSGNFLFVSNHANKSISVFATSATGALTEVAGSPFTIPASNCGLFCSPTADGMVYDSATQSLYVASEQGFIVAAFTVNTSTGALTWVYNTPTGYGPNDVTVDPTGAFVYVSNGGGSKNVSAFTATPTATSGGNPEPLTPITGQPFPAGGVPNSLVVDPSGKYLFVNNSGDNTISAYQIDSSTGALTPATGSPFSSTDMTTGHSQIAVDPSGAYVYVAAQGYNGSSVGGISVFNIGTGGVLTQTTGSPFGPGPNANEPFQIGVYKP